jgi:hypothetical protein
VAREADITPEEAAELERLYDQLPSAAAEASEALRFAIDTPTDAARHRYRECAARVNGITDRINQILG